MRKRQIKSYAKAVNKAQAELPPLERALSKLFHAPFLWHLGEFAETFFIRFIPMQLGYLIALFCGVLFVGVAYVFNYQLRSLHILFLIFGIGYATGIIVDYIRLLSKR